MGCVPQPLGDGHTFTIPTGWGTGGSRGQSEAGSLQFKGTSRALPCLPVAPAAWPSPQHPLPRQPEALWLEGTGRWAHRSQSPDGALGRGRGHRARLRPRVASRVRCR